MKRGILTCALMVVAPSAFADAKGDEVAQALYQSNLGYEDMSAKLSMVLKNAHGQESTREMRIRSLEQAERDEGDRSLVVFDSPRDIRGTALLSHSGVLDSDKQWLYLPSLKRVRRISTRNTSGPFMGSEFSYEDITGGEVDKYSWNMMGKGTCVGERQCFKLETKPKYEGSGYTRRIVWVDQQDHRIHKIEFYDRKNELLKTLTYSDYKKYAGKFWRAHRWEMVNHQSKKSTALVFAEFQFKNGFSSRDFSQSALKRIK